MLTGDSFRQHLILGNESKMKKEREKCENLSFMLYVPISRSVCCCSLAWCYLQSMLYVRWMNAFPTFRFMGTISSIKFNNMTLCTFLFRFCASNMQNVESWEKLNNISRFLYLYLSISFPHTTNIHSTSKGTWLMSTIYHNKFTR